MSEDHKKRRKNKGGQEHKKNLEKLGKNLGQKAATDALLDKVVYERTPHSMR